MKKLFTLLTFFLGSFLASNYVIGDQPMDSDVSYLFEKPDSAIFFEYVGILKSPFDPVFISSRQPNLKKINNIFKYTFGDIESIRRFIVSKEDLNVMVEKIKKELPEKDEFSKSKHSLKVDVGIVENGVLLKRTLLKDQAILVLGIAQNGAKDKYPKLFKELSTFKRRIGGGK